MKTIWRRFTQHTGGPSEDMPWYAPFLTVAFIAGAYAVVQTLDAAGY